MSDKNDDSARLKRIETRLVVLMEYIGITTYGKAKSEHEMNYDTGTPEGLERSMAWTHKTLSLLKPGGAWAIPRSNTFVYPDRENMTARVVLGTQPEYALIEVLKALGYTVTIEGENHARP